MENHPAQQYKGINNINAPHISQPNFSQTTHPTPYSTPPEDGDFLDPWPEGWGHASEPIDHQNLRVLLKNPNGIRPRTSDVCNKLDTGLLVLVDLDAGLLLINEHNSDTKQLEVRDGFKNKLMRHWTKNRTVFSSRNIPATNTYLPGGNLVAALGLWTGRFLTSEVDPTQMGRWSYMNIWGGK